MVNLSVRFIEPGPLLNGNFGPTCVALLEQVGKIEPNSLFPLSYDTFFIEVNVAVEESNALLHIDLIQPLRIKMCLRYDGRLIGQHKVYLYVPPLKDEDGESELEPMLYAPPEPPVSGDQEKLIGMLLMNMRKTICEWKTLVYPD